MIKIKISFLAIFLLALLTSQVIITDEGVLKSYKKNELIALRSYIEKDNYLKKNLPENLEVIVLPSCRYELNSAKGGAFEITAFRIDSGFGCAIFREKKVFAGQITKQGNYYSFTSRDQLPGKRAHLNLIAHALKYSPNPFFVYFLKEQKYWLDAIGFYNKGLVTLLDDSLHEYTNAEDFIKHRFGSEKKYAELAEDEKNKATLLSKITSIEVAKEVIRKDYINWQNAFPKDTIKVFTVFINEMDTIVHLTHDQKMLLRNKIINKSANQLREFDGYGIPFMKNDVSFEVKSILTREQYIKYLDERSLNSWLSTKASDQVFHYLKRERKIPDDVFDATYRYEVFGK